MYSIGRAAFLRLRSAAIVMAIAILACGCASAPKQIPVLEVRGHQLWTEADMVDVAISDTDRNRTDGFVNDEGRPGLRYATGPIWARLFIGEIGKSPLLTIRSAQLDSHFVALGFASRIRYSVDGYLSWNDREYPIHAEGTRTTEGLVGNPQSDAIQRGIIDAARKVRFIISGGLGSSPASTLHE